MGLLARQIAARYDAYTIGTVGRPEKVDFLRKQGYKEVIVRNPRQFGEQLEDALDGRPLNLVMECIGGKVFKAAYDRLAPQGRMVVYGSARYASVGNRPNYLRLFWQFLTRPRIDPQKIIEENKALLGFNLIWLYHQKLRCDQAQRQGGSLFVGKASWSIFRVPCNQLLQLR